MRKIKLTVLAMIFSLGSMSADASSSTYKGSFKSVTELNTALGKHHEKQDIDQAARDLHGITGIPLRTARALLARYRETGRMDPNDPMVQKVLETTSPEGMIPPPPPPPGPPPPLSGPRIPPGARTMLPLDAIREGVKLKQVDRAAAAAPTGPQLTPFQQELKQKLGHRGPPQPPVQVRILTPEQIRASQIAAAEREVQAKEAAERAARRSAAEAKKRLDTLRSQ